MHKQNNEHDANKHEQSHKPQQPLITTWFQAHDNSKNMLSSLEQTSDFFCFVHHFFVQFLDEKLSQLQLPVNIIFSSWLCDVMSP